MKWRYWGGGAFALAMLGLGSAGVGCGAVTEKAFVVHARDTAGARQLFRVAFTQQVTLPDNFVLRPDEFAAVTVDHKNGVVYAGSREGTLLALDGASGEVVWERNFGGAIGSQPTLVEAGATGLGRQLLVGTDNGELVCLDADTHKELWRYQTSGRIRAPAVVVQDVVYFVNSRDQVFALDRRTGDWRWQYEQEFSADFTVNGRAGLTYQPSDEAGTIYTGFDNGRVVALGAGAGEALWVTNLAPPEGGPFVDCDSTPLVDLQRSEVIVAAQSTGVHSLDVTDGSIKWRFEIRAAGTLVAGPGGDLIGASSLEGVFALDRTGRLLWRTQVDQGVLSAPVVVDDTVYVAHSETGLLAFDVDDGEYLARVDLGSGMSSVPVFDPVGGKFYATTNRGLLLALEIDRGWPPPSDPDSGFGQGCGAGERCWD